MQCDAGSRFGVKARRRIRAAVALGGLASALVALAALPPFGSASRPWVWWFFALWCVITPYWHYAEYRLLRDPNEDASARRDFLLQQGFSRAVWLGFGAVFAVWLLGSVRRTAGG